MLPGDFTDRVTEIVKDVVESGVGKNATTAIANAAEALFASNAIAPKS